MVERIEGKVLAREERPAEQKVRLVLATREPGTGRAIAVRVGFDLADDRAQLVEGFYQTHPVCTAIFGAEVIAVDLEALAVMTLKEFGQ